MTDQAVELAGPEWDEERARLDDHQPRSRVQLDGYKLRSDEDDESLRERLRVTRSVDSASQFTAGRDFQTTFHCSYARDSVYTSVQLKRKEE